MMTRVRRELPLAALALATLASAGSAQVGYDPEHSPFRDIRKGTGLAFGVGWFAGDAGNLGIGPTDGPTATGRLEISLGGPTLVTVGATYAQLERNVVDPDPDTLPVRTGPFGTDILMLDLGLQLRLTGQKSYRRLAPYLGAAMGLAFELSGPPDPGGYSFGTRFTLAPGAGVRIYPGRRLSMSVDFRVLFWTLSYPTSYQVGSPPLVPPGGDTSDWTTHPWTSVGVAWSF
jgi:hypothetical protein